MIEGIRIDVSSDELVARLAERIQFHHEKAKRYAAQIEALTSSGIQPNPSNSGDPFRDLTQHRDTHANKVALFTFMRDHVVPNETYRLSEQDLGRIEILDRYF